MADDKSMNDIFLMLGRMEGKVDTALSNQAKLNDVIFSTQRNHSRGIESLLQTRRTQWKVISLAIAGWAIIIEALHKFWPPIGPGP